MKSINDLMSLKGRVAVVTGGAGRIGSVMAEALAEIGANIVILDISLESCVPVCKRISKEYDVEVLSLAADLALEEHIRTVPDKVVDKVGRLDILVNCAAFIGTSILPGWAVPFEQQSVNTWRRALGVNMTAPFLLTQACTPALKQSEHGSVINIASIYGLVGVDMRLYEDTKLGNPAAYAASKGGLLQLTRWLASVLAPDIRANAITPGGVIAGQPDAFQRRYIERTPLKRMAVEEDLKGAIAYLASDLSAYVTGQNIIIDGGWTVW